MIGNAPSFLDGCQGFAINMTLGDANNANFKPNQNLHRFW
jgi:hypothetical protein